MSDPLAPVAQPAAVAAAASAPVVTQDQSDAVVNSVVSAVQSHPDVPAAAAPSIAATILAGLLNETPQIFAVSRASPRTQATVGIGLDLAAIILGAFLRR